jgi:hypothetical protein
VRSSGTPRFWRERERERKRELRDWGLDLGEFCGFGLFFFLLIVVLFLCF